MTYDRYVQELLARHREAGSPENVVILPVVGSTNALARLVAAEYESEHLSVHPLALIAYEQSGGRGRQGRSWSSPAGKGAYVTRVVEAADPAPLQSLPLLVGVGLCRALAARLPVPCRLKWPNDLVVEVDGERRKIGGILIEALVRPGERSLGIVGFGVNLLQGEGEMPETGTSLRLAGGEGGDLAGLTWELVAAVEAELGHLGDLAYAVEAYRPLSVHRPGEALVCRVGERMIEGTFAGFDEHGRLLLDSGGERIAVAAGEVIEE